MSETPTTASESNSTKRSTRAPPSKWASGRTLTDAQRARKREVDRNAQRNARIKERRRVEELEAQVRELQQAASLNSVPLTDMSRSTPANNANMMPFGYEDVMKNSASRHPSIGSETSSTSQDSVSERGLASYTQLTLDTWNPMETALWPVHTIQQPIIQSGIPIRPGGKEKSPAVQPTSQPNIQPIIQHVSPTLPFPPPPQEILSRSTLSQSQTRQVTASGVEVTKFCYDIIVSVASKSSKHKRPTNFSIITSQDITHDFLARVILHGWETALQRRDICPLWYFLRDIDEQIFRNCSTLVRLSILHLVHSKFMNVLKGTKTAPWHNPRPSQDLYPHNPVIDYIAWPGLRERLILSDLTSQTLLTNNFWWLLARSLRFNFSYPAELAFAFNSSTGMYSLSREYSDRFQDISNWGVTSEFFETFPKLRDDLSLAKELRWMGDRQDDGETSWKTGSYSAVKTFLVGGEEGQMVPSGYTEEIYGSTSQNVIDENNWTI